MKRWAGRVAGCAVALLLLLAAPTPAAGNDAGAGDGSGAPAPMQLQTTDGRTFVGQVVRDVPSHVLLRIGAVEARFERADVAKLAPVPDAAAGFAARRAALADDDWAGRLALAGAMFEADLLDAARWELVLLQAAVPDAGPLRDRVEAMLGAVAARHALRTSAAGPDSAPDSAPAAAPAPGPTAGAPAPRPRAAGARKLRPDYLSEASINLVRVYEIDLNRADGARVSVPESVLRDAMAADPDHPAVPKRESDRKALVRGSGIEQLALLFALEARELYPQAQVRQDPETLAAFRREINPGHVARYFEPHFGGGRVPGLNLVRRRPNTTAEAYTNFVALCRFRHEGRPMIDRFNPEASLLLQWALPRDEARHPAPDVPGWRPRFRSLRDPRCTRLRAWIDGLVKFDPDYATLLPRPPIATPTALPTAPAAGPAADADADSAPAPAPSPADAVESEPQPGRTAAPAANP